MSNEFFSEYSQMVEDCLKNSLKGKSDSYSILVDAMRYSALMGGKRVRPTILMLFL